MDISPLGTVGAWAHHVAPCALSKRHLDTLVVEIQGAMTGAQLEALERRIRALTVAPPGDPGHQPWLEQLLEAMHVRRDQLKLG